VSAAGPAARTFRLEGSYTDINRHYQDCGWTDGLPIVPPTEEEVREFLRWTDRDPRDVVAVLPPRQGEATVERIAIKEYVFEHARFPLWQLGEEYRRYFVEARKQIDDPGTLLPIANSPEAITVIVVGGAGKHSSWQPTFGGGTKPTRRVIARKDGTPLSSVAEIRRGGPTPT